MRKVAKAFCPYCMSPVKPGEACAVCGLTSGSYTPSPHHLPPGTVLKERYLVGRVLGEGGFGITYIGCDLRLELKVAIKEYYPVDRATRNNTASLNVTSFMGASGQNFEPGKQKFLDEARTMARMDKQQVIVSVRDYFEANNTAYIVMEYVEGTTFRDLVAQKGGRIPAGELLHMMEPLFQALGAMHDLGLIHRDISPENLMMENGTVRLLDFGCARQSSKGDETLTIALKHGYAPVEQYQNKGQGPWTDVYALSATIYYCLTGKKPPQAMDRLLEDELVLPRKLGVDLTEKQEKALLHGMGVRPKHRFQTMRELYAALYEGFQPGPGPVIATEPIIKTEPVVKTEPVIKTEPVVKTEPAGNPEPFVVTEPAGEPEPKQDWLAWLKKRWRPLAVIGAAVVIVLLAVLLMQAFRTESSDAGGAAGTQTDAIDQETPGTDGEPGTDPGVKPGADPGTEPDEEPGTEPGTEPGAEPDTEPDTKPDAEPGTEPDTKPTAEPGAADTPAPSNQDTPAPARTWRDNLLMADPGEADSAAFGAKFTRTEVGSITFLDTLSGAAKDAWDVSKAQDGSVLAWASKNSSTGLYDLYIGAEGGMTAPADCSQLFRWYDNAKYIKFNGAFHTSGVTNMRYMFNACSSLTTLDLSGFDTSHVTNMERMFNACGSLTTLNVSGFDTSNVTNMNSMFYGCKSLTALDVSRFDTSNVTNMKEMFRQCKNLTTLDVSSFDTAKVTNMSGMFEECSGLTALDVSGFDTSNVADMILMFSDCSSLTTLDLSSWDISSVTSMRWMFIRCGSLTKLDLSGWNISGDVNTDGMFDGVPESAIKY